MSLILDTRETRQRFGSGPSIDREAAAAWQRRDGRKLDPMR